MQRFSFEPLDSTSAERSVCWRAVILQTQKGLPSRGTWLSMLLEFCMWNFWGRTGSLHCSPTAAGRSRTCRPDSRTRRDQRTISNCELQLLLQTASRAERFKFSMGTVSLRSSPPHERFPTDPTDPTDLEDLEDFHCFPSVTDYNTFPLHSTLHLHSPASHTVQFILSRSQFALTIHF